MFRSTFLTAAALTLALGTSASALTAEQKVYKQVETEQADGTVKTSRVVADMIVPGEKVIYALRYLNDTQMPADGIVLTMPIPPVILFTEGSANTPLASIGYSADNGASFSSREQVMTVGLDGSLRAASAEELTHVRWSVTNSVAAGATNELSFMGTLK